MIAQDIIISFEYEMSRANAEDALAPYLIINYQNNSSCSYYFPALVSSSSVFPRFASTISNKHSERRITIDEVKEALFEKKLFNGEQHVLLLDYQQTISQREWSLINETEDDTYQESIMNYYLREYYDSLNENNTVFYSSQLFRCPHRLLHCPSLIFLKAGAETSQRISLHDLEKTGIILNILLSSPKSTNTVTTGWRKEDVISLPPKVRGYKLYDGIIQSNSLMIDFSK